MPLCILGFVQKNVEWKIISISKKNDKSFYDELYYRDVFVLLYISFIWQEEPFIYGKLIIEQFVKYQDILKHYETISIKKL